MVSMHKAILLLHGHLYILSSLIDEGPMSSGNSVPVVVGISSALSWLFLYVMFVGWFSAPIVYWLLPLVGGWYMCT